MNKTSIKAIIPLGFPWQTQDPFIFCAYHEDKYPKGNGNQGPDASLVGRAIGQDFQGKDGWNMYHGSTVPGFPAHPHYGFETVTIVQKGLVDHADSLGAAGRFGNGDVQWMTAGNGVQHSEMFPLLNTEKENPFLLFQIWLNLPRAGKSANPYFSMLWRENIPLVKVADEQGHITEITVVSGELNGEKAPAPPPDSWAANAANEVAIYVIKMEPHAQWELPKASGSVNRSLFFFKGNEIQADGQMVSKENILELDGNSPTLLINGDSEAHFLFLQGKSIGEPVFQYGPFVTNTQGEIREVMLNYQQSEFGGWPWPKHDQVHDPKKGRFAIHADGRLEEKTAI